MQSFVETGEVNGLDIQALYLSLMTLGCTTKLVYTALALKMTSGVLIKVLHCSDLQVRSKAIEK